MRLKIKIIAIVSPLAIISSILGYVYVDYLSTPFSASWEQNLGEPVLLTSMGSIVANGTLFWLGTYSQNMLLFGAKFQLTLMAINVTHGNDLWRHNITVRNAAIESSAMPYLYWQHDRLLLILYKYGNGYDQNVSVFANYSILMMYLNAGTGAIEKTSVYNRTYVDPMAPLSLYGNELYSWYVQQMGVSYYYNGIYTSYYGIGVFGVNISNGSYWNDTIYRQGNPSFITPSLIATNNTLSLAVTGLSNELGYQGNTTFMGFNRSNGEFLWNFTSSGGFDGLWSVGNEILFSSTNSGYRMEYFDAQNGLIKGSFNLTGSRISLVQGRFLYIHNGHYSAMSGTGGKLWTADQSLSTSSSAYIGTIGLSPGYAMAYSVGSHSQYYVINLSNGHVVWNRYYYSIASIFGGSAISEVPILFGDGHLICFVTLQDNEFILLSVNIASIGVS